MRRLGVSLLAAVALVAVGPAATAGAQQPPKLDAEAWLLLDARDGAELASGAPNRELPIASATKLMTAFVVLAELPIGKRLRAPAYRGAPAEVVLGLREGERTSVRDLLRALLVMSANDAAVALAEGASGSVDAFVRRMNREARWLGLDETRFSNPIGLDAPDNHSSARDLATLTLELQQSKLFREIVSTAEVRLKTGAQPRDVVTRNDLLARKPWVDGVKTGHTNGAGYVLVGSGTRDGVSLVSVVLGAPNEAARDAESLKLLNYGFSLYEASIAVPRGRVLADPEVEFSDGSLPLVAARPVEITARQDQVVDTAIEAPAQVEGPIARRERLGEAVVTIDGEPAGSTPLVAARAVGAPSTLDRLGVWLPVPLIAAGLLVIVVALVGARRRSKRGWSAEEGVEHPIKRLGRREEEAQ